MEIDYYDKKYDITKF